MTNSSAAVVLVVDDEPHVADTYAAQIRDRYAVETAYNGEAALERLDEEIDVVLLDRRMPDLLGDEVLETIRDRRLDCRVAMVTAVNPDVDIIDMPFDDYVVKPVNRAGLLDTIDRLLRCSEYEDRLREYYRVTRKYATLTSATDRRELEASEEFRELEERKRRLREELDAAIEEFADEDFETLFRNLDPEPVPRQ